MRDLTNSNPVGDPPPHYQQQEDPHLDFPAMQLSPMAMRDEVLRSTAQRSTAQPLTRRGWSTPTTLLLLALSLCRLPYASSSDSFSAWTSASRRLQPSDCSCAPMEYTFKLDLTLTCPPPNINNPTVNVDISNPGITEYFCEIRQGVVDPSSPVTDFVPVEINEIRVIELDRGFQPQKSLVLGGLQAVSGFTFQFESKLTEGLDDIPDDIPGGLQIILRGKNEAGQAIINTWATSYSRNNCDTEPIYTPRIANTDPSIGWSELVDETPPLSELCPAVPVTDEPSTKPTTAPTPIPTDPPTPSPTTVAPTPKPTPTDPPTLSPTTVAPTKTPTAKPTPTDPPTPSPTTVAPSKTPTLKPTPTDPPTPSPTTVAPSTAPTPTDPPTPSPTTVAPNARPTDTPTPSPTIPPTQKPTPTVPPLTPAPTSGVPSTPTPTPRSSLRPEHSTEPTPFSMSYSMNFNFDYTDMFDEDVLADYFHLVDMDSSSSSEDKKAKSGKHSKQGKGSKSKSSNGKQGKGSKEKSSSKDGRQRQLRLRRTPLADKLIRVEQ